MRACREAEGKLRAAHARVAAADAALGARDAEMAALQTRLAELPMRPTPPPRPTLRLRLLGQRAAPPQGAPARGIGFRGSSAPCRLKVCQVTGLRVCSG